MASNNVNLSRTEYELIDVDPHFKRTIAYFRASDYGRWAVFTAAGPLFLSLSEYIQSEGKRFAVRPPLLRLSLTLGFSAGFIYSYNKSVKRFQGVTENTREVAKDRYEIKSRLSKGLKPYGESDLPDWLQKVAARNSTHANTFLHIIPWFNFVHHEYHGVDLKKYYETRPGEESWGFNLSSEDVE